MPKTTDNPTEVAVILEACLATLQAMESLTFADAVLSGDEHLAWLKRYDQIEAIAYQANTVAMGALPTKIARLLQQINETAASKRARPVPVEAEDDNVTLVQTWGGGDVYEGGKIVTNPWITLLAEDSKDIDAPPDDFAAKHGRQL